MAIPNGLNPSVTSVEVNGGLNIYGGSAGTTTTIEAQVGADALTCGSIYISSATSGEIWFLIQGDGGDGHNVWTKLTIN